MTYEKRKAGMLDWHWWNPVNPTPERFQKARADNIELAADFVRDAERQARRYQDARAERFLARARTNLEELRGNPALVRPTRG